MLRPPWKMTCVSDGAVVHMKEEEVHNPRGRLSPGFCDVVKMMIIKKII
jgi:hypothetical protein